MLTEGPIGHRRGTADELSVLLHHLLRRRPGEEVKIENSSDYFVSYPITSINDVHSITVEQENAVCCSNGEFPAVVRKPDVDVERVRTIQIDIEIGAADIGIPERQSLVMGELQGLLGVLSQAVNGGAEYGEGGGDLEVLVLEY